MIHFIVHAKQDSVGVVVQNVEESQQLIGWNMETDQTLNCIARQEIPLGHKVALGPIAVGERVIKYNVPIGEATREIDIGQHVHTHNLKSARW
jgi:(2R)-sulfolactate sulfo-lyase subunit alpha